MVEWMLITDSRYFARAQDLCAKRGEGDRFAVDVFKALR
jgi:hypothetical protein